MLWKTHAAIGAAAGCTIAARSGVEVSYVPIVASAIGSLLPDIDTPNSKLGSKFISSRVVSGVFGHRGFTHSFAGMALFVGLFGLALPVEMVKYIGIGYLSHIVADMLNPAGVPLLWPKKARFRLPVMVAGGIGERYILFPASLFFLARHLLVSMP